MLTQEEHYSNSGLRARLKNKSIMAIKRYISTDGVKRTILFEIGNKSFSVSFRGSECDFHTKDKAIQEALENSKYFKDGKVKLYGILNSSEREDVSIVDDGTKEHPEITNINDAIEFLNKEHKVAKAKMKSPDTIRAIAESLSISFPNWTD